MLSLDHARTYSLKVLEAATADPAVPFDRYQDLREIVEVLGLGVSEPLDVDDGPVFPAEGLPNLMVLDDEPTLARLIEEGLIGRGYPAECIHTFESPSEALRFASNNSVGISFIDIKLDGAAIHDPVYTSGMEVLRAIKKDNPDSRAILVSGFGTYEMARRGILDLGASFYMSKPFRMEDIVRIVSWATRSQIPTFEGANGQDPRGERILIVDDDVALSESVALGKRSFGYRTFQVSGGEAATEAIRSARFDAVLLDLMMPRVSGLDVMRWLQRERRRVDVFILSAVSDDLTARQATALGAAGYFIKPCDISLITRTLEFHFANRERASR